MPGVPAPLRRLLHLISRHGLSHALPQVTRPGAPTDPYPQHTPPAIHPFDLTHNVQTSGYVHGEHLGGSGRAALWNTAYYAIAPSAFHAALAALQPHLPGPPPASAANAFAPFTFIDLGCGRGRALLLASGYPFHRILGVELDPTLAAGARHNLITFHSPAQQCRNLEVRTGDAATLAWPPAPTILFLYNPFLAPALRRVLAALELSLSAHPRDLFLVYLNPEPAAILDHHPRFVELHRSTLHLAPTDQLADRLGSSTEDLRLYRFLPHP